jgi:glycosyltransferase involved in cell wall biosynthesis
VAAGRLAEVKNYPLLIEAFAIVRRRIPASLFILGQGDQERALRALIGERGLGDCVHLVGFRANPWRYMARADVFALTSRYEGFGNVVVEAMACGVPVVATSSAGTEEIVSPGVDGVLVPSHDAASFAAALETLLADEPRRRSLAAGAKASAERDRALRVARDVDGVMRGALA